MQVNDIVRLSNGSELIITEVKLSRPANPYLGVLVNGRGTVYKFGPRNKPVVIGIADDNHPALAAMKSKRSGVDNNFKTVVSKLLDAVDAGDLVTAEILADVVRSMMA